MVNGKSRLRCCKAWVCCGESRSRVVVTNTIERFPDVVGRSVACDMFGNTFDTPDANSYLYNTRSELTNATATVDATYSYGYNFDDIGNRKTSAERGTNVTYAVNHLNQYTEISNSTVQPLASNLQPLYDADGNQTLVKTATGIWRVTYNGENRPVCWELVSPNSNTQTLLLMSYDRMGRRVTKNNQHFVYNDYLQITDNIGNTYIWDCTENVATRPLEWSRNGDLAYYVFDGNKNVSEVISTSGSLAAHYEYTPFGAITVSRGVSAASNHWRFSSEYAEDDTTTIYYNYRHYDPINGRWLSRDGLFEVGGLNLYGFCANSVVDLLDTKGDSWLDFHPNNPPAEVGFGEGLIPIYGSLREFDVATYNGEWGKAMFYAVLAVSDVTLVRSILTSCTKGCWKLGSHSWSATRQWYVKHYGVSKGTQIHHRIIPQHVIRRYRWLETIANQPWNLHPIEGVRGLTSQQMHLAVHGLNVSVGKDSAKVTFNLWQRYWYGSSFTNKMFDWYFADRIIMTIDLVNEKNASGDAGGTAVDAFDKGIEYLKVDSSTNDMEW